MASSSVAAAQLAVFGNCPALNPFPATESDDTAAAESAAYDMSKDVSVKRHAACDDCRLSSFTLGPAMQGLTLFLS